MNESAGWHFALPVDHVRPTMRLALLACFPVVGMERHRDIRRQAEVRRCYAPVPTPFNCVDCATRCLGVLCYASQQVKVVYATEYIFSLYDPAMGEGWN